MKKVLIISSHFAPDAHVGAKRPTKFCKFLSEFGWDSIVITQPIESYHLTDDTLLDDLPSNIKIHRIKKYAWFARWDYTLFSTCISWLIPAFFMAWRISKNQKVNVIMSTAPGFEAHAAALLVKLFTGKKWICDWRDLFFAYHYKSYYQIILWADQWLIRLLLKNADSNIFVCRSLKKKYLNISKNLRTKNILNSKSVVIYNGFDPDDFLNVSFKDNNVKRKFVITYNGTWGTGRSPEPFLQAVKNLIENEKEIKENIKIQLIGEFKFDSKLSLRIKQVIKDYNLGDVINLIQFMSYKNGLKKLCRSDLLLLFLPHIQVYYTPAKLYEYLYSRKLILAVVPPQGESAQIIKETQTGVVVSPSDIAGIEDAILSIYENFKKGRLIIKPNQGMIAKYNRRKQTKSLVDIIENLVVHRKNQNPPVIA